MGLSGARGEAAGRRRGVIRKHKTDVCIRSGVPRKRGTRHLLGCHTPQGKTSGQEQWVPVRMGPGAYRLWTPKTVLNRKANPISQSCSPAHPGKREALAVLFRIP